MIPPHLEAKAVELLAAGRSQRSIARQLGISRGTVTSLSSGRRPRDLSAGALPNSTPAAHQLRGVFPNGPAVRQCRRCGASLQISGRCHACWVRSLGLSATTDAGFSEVIGLELRPRHHARYLEVKQLRQIAAAALGIDLPPPLHDNLDDLAPTPPELLAIESEG